MIQVIFNTIFIVFQSFYSAYFSGAMACSELMVKSQEASLFPVSLAFIGRFEQDVVLLILIFIALQFLQGLLVKTKESVFSLASFVFPDNLEQVFHGLEQHVALVKISLYCILNFFFEILYRHCICYENLLFWEL